MANNQKMNISYTIRAIDRFSKTHSKLERQLNKLNDTTRGFADDNKEIDIDVDAHTEKAEHDLKRTDRLARKIPNLIVIKAMTQGFKKGINDADNFAQKLRTMEELSQGMGRGLLNLGIPTFASALGVAAGAAGALASSLTSIGIAGAAMGGVMIPTISNILQANQDLKAAQKKVDQATTVEQRKKALEKLKAVQDSLTGSQMRGVKVMQQLSLFSKQFENQSTDVFVGALEGLLSILQRIKPAIEGMFDATNNLFDSFNQNLNADDMKKFFEWINTTAGPNFEKFVKTIGNFFAGFLNLMVGFDPLAQDMADGLLNMSERFREWSANLENNQAFQNFLSYVKENGPKLVEFLGQLITFLTQLGIAIAPVGEQVMELVGAFLEWATEMLKNNETLGTLTALFFVLKGAISLVLPVLSFLMIAFRTIWPLVSTLWGWIGRLIPIIARILPWILRFGGVIAEVAVGPIGWIIQAVILLAIIIWQNWDAIKKWTINAWGRITNYLEEKWAEIQATWEIVKVLANMLFDWFDDMSQTVSDKMDEIWNWITDAWDNIKSYLGNLSLFAVGRDIIKGLIKGIKSIDVKAAAKSIGHKIKSGFTDFFDINSPSRVMHKDVGRWITMGVLDGMTAMGSKAERQATVVANAIKRPFDEMANADYSFTANARGAYESTRYPTNATTTPAVVSNEAQTNGGDLRYAVINIGGYEAKGVVQYLTREQKRSEATSKRFT